MLAFVLGKTTAYIDLTSNKNDFKIAEGDQLIGVVLMRTFEKGMLLRLPDKRIVFRDWEGSEKFSFEQPPVDDRRRVCIYFGWFCA